MAQKKACDACYKRKIQCDFDSGDTRCDWCDHQGLACTFNRVRGRKKPGAKRLALNSRPKTHPLENTLQESAEEHEQQSHSNSDLDNSPKSVPLPCNQADLATRQSGSYQAPIAYSHINYDGRHFGHMSHVNGIPILSEEGKQWISSRTGEEVSFKRFETDAHHQVSPHWLSLQQHTNSNDPYDLPDQGAVTSIFDIYIHSAFSKVFPFVDRRLFPETIRLAYRPRTQPMSVECVSAKACVLAFLSCICLFRGGYTEFPPLDLEKSAVQARYLLSYTAETPILSTLQAVVMIAFYEISSGRDQSAATFHAVACRIIFKLGGHIRLPPKHIKSVEDIECNQARLLFWLGYVLDKDIALRTGQPPLMSGEYCDLTIPDGYDECYTYLPLLDDNLRLSDALNLTPHLPEDPRLSQLKEKVSQRLYSAQAAKKNNAELLRDIRELDEALEAWRLSIPRLFRPALSISDKSRVDVGEMAVPRSMCRITLHLGYHHLMIAIHRASGRCMSSAESAGDAEQSLPGVQSSMALALEACRSTLIYLRAAISGVAGEAFWIIVFYPTAAMMALFLNILMDPLNPQVEADVALLASTADLINSLPIHRLTSHEVAHVELVTEFVAELSALSKKAIAKATAECTQRRKA